MIYHVEHHLRQLSLAALTANPEDDNEDSESELSQSGGDSAAPPGYLDLKQPGEIEPLENHHLFKHAVKGPDGLFHCPWEGEDYCGHQPSILRADYEYVRPSSTTFV
jgi:hypothetical protein